MAQTGYTPIQLYHSTTGAATPSAGNLANGEVALNIADTDMAVYAKNASGAVKRIMNNPAGLKYPTADGTANQVIKTDGAGNLSFGTAAAGDVVGPASSVANEIVLFDGTTGKLVKSATTTGIVKATSGVISAAVAGTDYVTPTGTETLTNKTLTTPTIENGYTETVYALSGTALAATNGSIQTKTLSGNTTFTDSMTSGQSIVLMLNGGSSYTVTWPTMTWVKSGGSAAPTLTAGDCIVFWKISTTLYGAYVGSTV